MPSSTILWPPSVIFRHQKTTTTGCQLNTTIEEKKEQGNQQKSYFPFTCRSKSYKLVSRILRADKWLTDKHMDDGQWLVSQKYPQAKGLHSVLAFQSKQPKVDIGLQDFVQVLHLSGNHWVAATNIGYESNKFKVYDSLYRELSNEHKEHLYTSLAAMLQTSERNVIIEWPSMVQQSGTADCGMYALAVAISLCNCDDPTTQAYDQRVMTAHLALCFECGELAAFPV